MANPCEPLDAEVRPERRKRDELFRACICFVWRRAQNHSDGHPNLSHDTRQGLGLLCPAESHGHRDNLIDRGEEGFGVGALRLGIQPILARGVPAYSCKKPIAEKSVASW